MKIGVLALQGAFAEHIHILQRLGVQCCEIRQDSDFTLGLDGIILPGGESTVIGKLLDDLALRQPIHAAIGAGLPVFGTCAGMILLAKEIAGTDNSYMSVVNMRVKRNAYGRQLGSFTVAAPFADIGETPMVFIRAPSVETVWSDAKALAAIDGKIVAVRQNNVLATAFHPELTGNMSVHGYFLEMVGASKRKFQY